MQNDLIIETIISGLLENNTYVIKYGKNAIIIDAASSIDKLKEKTKGYNVIALILTHAHYDHIINLKEILQHFNIPCFMHKNAYAKLTNKNNCADKFGLTFNCDLDFKQVKFVEDNQKLNLFDNVTIKIIHTPGHSDCGICIIVDDIMFTGDTLFDNCCGRTDLPTGSIADMKNSLKKLKTNYKGCLFYSGHGKPSTIL